MEKSSYSDYISDVFTRASQTYDEEEPKFFTYFGRKLANNSPISYDMNVLDIGTGRGAVFYPLYEELSHQGCLIGIDSSDGMVDKVNTELLAYKLQNAVVIKMNAEKLDFPDEFFDLVTCGLSIFLFENVEKALSEVKRVLKSTGYFTFSTWLGLDINQYEWYEKVIKKYLPPPESQQETDNSKEHINFFTTQGIERLLQKYNFNLIKMATEKKNFVYTSAENFWNKIWSGAERTTLEKIPEEKLDSFKNDLFNSFNAVKGKDGFEFTMGIIYVCCNK